MPKAQQPSVVPDIENSMHSRPSRPASGHAPKFTHADVSKKLKFDYLYGSKEAVDRALSSIDELFTAARRPSTSIHDLLEQAATMIYKQLRIREVSIGLRDPKDGLYRYEVMAGMASNKWRAHGNLAYAEEDFLRNDKWRGTMISKYTKLMLAEDNPYAEGEEKTVDRQEMLTAKRHNLDDSIEGDYMDIMIPGLEDDLIGWIEISGTWASKLPDPQTIRLIELIGCTLGVLLSHNDHLSLRGS